MAKYRTELDPWTDASVALNGAVAGLESAVSFLNGKTDLADELSLLCGRVVFLRGQLAQETELKRKEFALDTAKVADGHGS